MGQKCNPLGFRLGGNVEYRSCWFSDRKNFAKECVEDYRIRYYIRYKFCDACIEDIFIDKVLNKVVIHTYCLKPNLIIGKDGETISALCVFLEKMTKRFVFIYVNETPDKNLSAVVKAYFIAEKIKNRQSAKRVAKSAAQELMQNGAAGVKICLSGRLGGAEIARSEVISEGSVPLNSLSNVISYAAMHIKTEYGIIGLKVFINQGRADRKNRSSFRVFNKKKGESEINKKMIKKK